MPNKVWIDFMNQKVIEKPNWAKDKRSEINRSQT